MREGALSILAENKIVEQLVAVVRFIRAEGAPGEMLLQELLPNLFVSVNRARLQTLLHRGQVHIFPIIGDGFFCGWLRFDFARGDHVLIAEFFHSLAVCAVMFLVTITQLMGYTLLHPINVCKVPHKEAATGLVDRPTLEFAFHDEAILCASKTASNGTLVLVVSCLLINKMEAHAVR